MSNLVLFFNPSKADEKYPSAVFPSTVEKGQEFDYHG